ncbi:MAG: DUF3422 domain-containing protein [Pseudomonadota bacterium]
MRFENHPQRLALTNELHARPFQPMAAPGRVLLVAIKQPTGAAERDAQADIDHLLELLDRHGAPHPAPNASHHSVDLGPTFLKWERHTEFVSYTLYQAGEGERAFDTDLLDHLPEDWLERGPGKVLAAIQVDLITAEHEAGAVATLSGWFRNSFVSESLAAAWVLERSAMITGDFRIHKQGLTRFGMVIFKEVGQRRIGRVCQRLLEIEVYRSLAMLALPIARRTMHRLTEIELALSELIGQVSLDESEAPESMLLADLTEMSAEIEALAADAAFRFGAGSAYESIVHERIEMLGEERVEGRQQFREFMLRRFDPAMRTVHAAQRRLGDLSARASRAAELLRTRVNVVLEAQNQKLLESMDRRAALQLRLQATVEGLSVVAISYYAVSLAGYALAPFADTLGVDKTTLTALATVPVIGAVWWLINRRRRRLEGSGGY